MAPEKKNNLALIISIVGCVVMLGTYVFKAGVYKSETESATKEVPDLKATMGEYKLSLNEVKSKVDNLQNSFDKDKEDRSKRDDADRLQRQQLIDLTSKLIDLTNFTVKKR